MSLVGATGSLAQLRRSLVRGSLRNPLVLCITLDDATLRRYGRALASMLDDRCSFPTPVHAIGVMIGRLPVGWESLGFDALASSAMHLQAMLDAFDARSQMAFGDRFSFATIDELLDGTSPASRNRSRSADTRFMDF